MSDIHSRPGDGSDAGLQGESKESENIKLSSEAPTGPPSSSESGLNPVPQSVFDEVFLAVKDLCIKLGENIRYISREHLLSYFWTNGPDTPCMVCGEEFDDARGPPIRTFSIDEDDHHRGDNLMLALSKLVIHIHNRHLECAIKLGIQFTTVSHVWHQEVGDAHLSRRSTTEAVALAWFVPVSILNSVRVSLKGEYDRVELWHDYLSVPQWNYTVQQQLLLYLPAIYKASSLCLIHLDDISNSILETAFNRTASSREALESIAQFFQSHWFRRLWVALEYMSCTRACLMVENNTIIPVRQDLESFTPIMDFLRDRNKDLVIKESESSNETRGSYPLAANNVGVIRVYEPKLRILGEMYHLVSRLECRTYRDRFIAITGLLGLGDYTENVKQIPSETTAACHWVAMKCLERGDFTPLLLVHTGESDVPYARWLRGHEQMHILMWTAGLVESVPANLNIIKNGRVEPELEYVGTIEEAGYIDFRERWPLSAFEFVVTFLLQEGNNIFSAADLVNTLLRIYAVPPYITRNYPTPNTFEEYCDANPDFESEIMAIIVIYLKLLPRTEHPDRLTLCQILAKKLFFDKLYTSNMNSYTRLSYAGSHADDKFYLDLLARVRCGGCERPFVFRIGLYTAYKIGWVGQKLYRIPGLSCIGFPGNGMCLIMAGTLIRGRTTFGTPACTCSIRERVLIE